MNQQTIKTVTVDAMCFDEHQPKLGIQHGDRKKFWDHYNSKLIEAHSETKKAES